MSDSPLSRQEIRAAAAAHDELGPEYSDAVVASFLGKSVCHTTVQQSNHFAMMAQHHAWSDLRSRPGKGMGCWAGYLAPVALSH